ncbi:hypothetical protein [Saccharopolyspora sp. CA-218241]|uniref:hypothetical protein n=1 Tax=Saccharopolyspora sp. CA-218241 TaxID=3240027 RepID=UPI003D99BD02
MSTWARGIPPPEPGRDRPPADNGEAFGPHVLRHIFGTDLLRGRGDLAAELVGHVDLNATRR